LLVTGKNARDIAFVNEKLGGEFEMKDLGELTHFLGMGMSRGSGGAITVRIISQSYTKD